MTQRDPLGLNKLPPRDKQRLWGPAGYPPVKTEAEFQALQRLSEPACPNCGCADIRLGECQCTCHGEKVKESFTVRPNPAFEEGQWRFNQRVYTICKREVR